jgi:transcriptional regulator with XRE-family HTH domain
MVDEPVHKAHVRLLGRLKRNVRDFRRAMNLTVNAAAVLADVHWRYWQKVEAGEVNATLAIITRMANALGVEPQHLLLPRSSPERGRLLREAMKHASKPRKGGAR